MDKGDCSARYQWFKRFAQLDRPKMIIRSKVVDAGIGRISQQLRISIRRKKEKMGTYARRKIREISLALGFWRTLSNFEIECKKLTGTWQRKTSFRLNVGVRKDRMHDALIGQR